MVSAEAVCTQSFLEYAHNLLSRQQLDRILIDECHLTIATIDYRPCMSQLGWYIRQIRMQTVWLTGTLSPVLQEEFIAEQAGQAKSHQRIYQPAEHLVHDQPREWGGDFNREGCYSGSSLLAPKGSV